MILNQVSVTVARNLLLRSRFHPAVEYPWGVGHESPLRVLLMRFRVATGILR